MNRKKEANRKSGYRIVLALLIVGIFVASGGLFGITSYYTSTPHLQNGSTQTADPEASSSQMISIGLVSSIVVSSLNYFSPVSNYYFTSMLYLPFEAYEFAPQPYLEPVLAHYYTHNKTYESWNLTLKKNLKWDNGAPLNSSDLWISLALYNQTGEISSLNVSSITIINSTTVNVVTSSPEPNFMIEWVTDTNSYLVPYQTFHPLDPNVHAVIGKSLDTFANFKNIVADGPFVITNYTAGINPIIFQANKYYYRGAPRMSSLSVRIFSSASSMSAGMRSGEIDAMWDMGAYNTIVKPEFAGVAGATTYQIEPAGYMSAVYNLKQWPYNTTQFRQALAYLTNRSALTSIVDYANASMAQYNGMIPSLDESVGINPSSVNNYTYNVQKANALLNQIGIMMDKQKGTPNYGLYVYNNSQLPCYGKPVTINITTTQLGFGDLSTSVELSDQWEAAGFKADIVSISSTSFYPLTEDSSTGWSVAVSIDYSGFPPLPTATIDAIIVSDNTTAGYHTNYKDSFGMQNYDYSTLSKLFNESIMTPEYSASSNKYIQEASSLISSTVPILPLFVEENTVDASNSYYWGNATNHTGLWNTQALVQPDFWYGTLWVVHPLVSTKTTTSSSDLYLYVIAGVVAAVVVIGGVAGVMTSKKHKKVREKEEKEEEEK